MFKSSSKIDEGLDAIVEDGGEAEEVELEEDLKTQKETADYDANDRVEIEPVLIETQVKQNDLATSETIQPEIKEEEKENIDLDTDDHVEIEPVPINPQIEQNAVTNLKPTEPEEKNFYWKNSRSKKVKSLNANLMMICLNWRSY